MGLSGQGMAHLYNGDANRNPNAYFASVLRVNFKNYLSF